MLDAVVVDEWKPVDIGLAGDRPGLGWGEFLPGEDGGSHDRHDGEENGGDDVHRKGPLGAYDRRSLAAVRVAVGWFVTTAARQVVEHAGEVETATAKGRESAQTAAGVIAGGLR